MSFVNVFSAMLASVVVMLAMWQSFDPRVMIVFVIFLIVTEVFIQIRWRLSTLCQNCGFDPILYIKAPQKAAEKVKIHLEKRRQDPKSLFLPPLNLPTLSAEKSEALKQPQRKGQLVSKSI